MLITLEVPCRAVLGPYASRQLPRLQARSLAQPVETGDTHAHTHTTPWGVGTGRGMVAAVVLLLRAHARVLRRRCLSGARFPFVFTWPTWHAPCLPATTRAAAAYYALRHVTALGVSGQAGPTSGCCGAAHPGSMLTRRVWRTQPKATTQASLSCDQPKATTQASLSCTCVGILNLVAR